MLVVKPIRISGSMALNGLRWLRTMPTGMPAVPRIVTQSVGHQPTGSERQHFSDSIVSGLAAGL